MFLSSSSRAPSPYPRRGIFCLVLFLFFVLVFSKRGGVEGEGEGNCDLTISRISNIFCQKKQKMMRKTSRAGEQHQSGHQEEDEDEQDEDEQDEQLEREQQEHGQEEQEQ